MKRACGSALVSLKPAPYFSTRFFAPSLHNGHFAQACTTTNVFVKLVGFDGESKRTWLKSIKGVAAFFMGMVSLHVSTLNLGLSLHLSSMHFPALTKLSLCVSVFGF